MNDSTEKKEKFDKSTLERELGTQPLDTLMEEYSLRNQDVVSALPFLQLSHKVMGKARKGRRISRKLQAKVTQAFNAAIPEDCPRCTTKDLFNY
jgi:hypothetical protein